MWENEFEKKVHEQMEELTLRPSETVWPGVEKELRRKKRRRGVIYISLLAGLALLGYSGYNFFNTDKESVVQQPSLQQPVIQQDQSDKTRVLPRPDNAPVTDKVSGNHPSLPVESQTNGNTGTSNTTQTTTGNKQTYKASGEKNPEAVFTIKSSAINKKKKPELTQSVIPVVEQVQEKQDISIVPPSKTGVENDATVAVNPLPEQKIPAVVNEKDTAKAVSLPADSLLKDNVVPVIAKKTKKPGKIKLGLDLAYGTAMSRTTIFSFRPAAGRALMDYNSPGNGAGNPGNAPSPSPPSAVKNGLAFKAGVTAELKLSQRSSVSAGLRYAYLSEKIKAGNYIDTVILSNSYNQAYYIMQDRIYRSVPQKEYTNKYHFIELPLLYRLQLGKGKKLPLSWNAGISTGYMIATNALVYDTAAGGVYYHDKNLFNKLQFSFLTGLSLDFGSGKKMQWSLGPEIALHMTPQLKQNDIMKKKYLLYGGVTARLLFPARKK